MHPRACRLFYLFSQRPIRSICISIYPITSQICRQVLTAIAATAGTAAEAAKAAVRAPRAPRAPAAHQVRQAPGGDAANALRKCNIALPTRRSVLTLIADTFTVSIVSMYY
jgi:hypothetical protein